MNDVNLIMNGTFILLGLYLLILACRAKLTGFVHQVLMLDRTMSFSRCRDKEGYIGYIFPRIAGCGLLLAALGAYSVLASGSAALQFPYYRMVLTAVGMFVCIWYMTIIRTAGDKYY